MAMISSPQFWCLWVLSNLQKVKMCRDYTNLPLHRYTLREPGLWGGGVPPAQHHRPKRQRPSPASPLPA